MKLIDINGNPVIVDVRQSSWPIRGISKSKLQSIIGEKLVKKYPYFEVLEEWRIPGTMLTFDFFVPKIQKAFEIQGIQHLEHNNFFHGDKATSNKFAKQIKRDMTKVNWCEMNNIKLVEIFKEEDFNNV